MVKYDWQVAQQVDELESKVGEQEARLKELKIQVEVLQQALLAMAKGR